MSAPPHPADFLNEVLMPATGRSDGEVARLLGVSLAVFYTILTREKPISPSTAAMLGRLFNTGEGFWLKMQADYDRFVAPQNVVEARVATDEISARPSSLGQALPLRPLPTPSVSESCPTPDEHAVSGFGPLDVGPWVHPIHGNGSSNIG
jgi:addiction module HigA family antidote